MKYFFVFFATLFCSTMISAQNQDYYTHIIRDLTQPEMSGRGLPQDGFRKAADYVEAAFKSYGLQTERQPFTYPTNIFDGEVFASVDGKPLTLGQDLVFREMSPSCEYTAPLAYIPKRLIHPDRLIPLLQSGKYAESILVLDRSTVKKYWGGAPLELYRMPHKGIILRMKGYATYFISRANFVERHPVMFAGDGFPRHGKTMSIKIEAQYYPQVPTCNIIAFLPAQKSGAGSAKKKAVMVEAHYDHLGHLGRDIWFPGANDNASGVAMMLCLAKHFAAQGGLPDRDLIFMATGAEENNLLGAFHYVDHPRYPLDSLACVLNLDMLADDGHTLITETGDERTGGPACTDVLEAINKRLGSFRKIRRDPLTDDSDHYPFAAVGVPAIYFTVEHTAIRYYHTPLDDMDHISTVNYQPLFSLFEAFMREL